MALALQMVPHMRAAATSAVMMMAACGPTAIQVDASEPGLPVELVVEPNGNGAQELLDAIASARSTIDVEVYQMGDRRFADALVERARAGVGVTVVLDGADINRERNVYAYEHLSTAGANVAWSSTAFQYTHAKVLAIDGESAWVTTMNLDYTSPYKNREYLALVRDPQAVAEVESIVRNDAIGRTNDIPIGPLIVANANARPRIAGLIQDARAEIDVEVEELGDSAMADELAEAARRGVTVRVAIAKVPLASWQRDAVDAIRAGGGTVVAAGPDAYGTGTPYLHAKAIAIDRKRVFVGSENLSETSLDRNREVGVVVDTPAAVAKVLAAFDADFASGAPP